MTENILREKVEFDPSFGWLKDVDIHPNGKWAAVFRVEDDYQVRVGDLHFTVHDEITSPLRIRWVNDETLVLVSPRITQVKDNVWIYTISGDRKASFCAGDAVRDILTLDDLLVFTYFDEGIFGKVPPSSEGLTAFSLQGELMFGYRSNFKGNAVTIADCHCACLGEDQSVWFLPYPDFPLVNLDLLHKRQVQMQLPIKLHYASAMASKKDVFFFFNPHKEPNRLFAWKKEESPVLLGLQRAPIRVIQNGQFIYIDRLSFTIITPRIAP